MAYRDPPAGRAPQSPEIDASVLAVPWSVPVLISSLYALPILAVVIWVGDGAIRGWGTVHVMTLAEKVAVSLAYLLGVAGLVVANTLHRRRQRLLCRQLAVDTGSFADIVDAGVRAGDARMRVAGEDLRAERDAVEDDASGLAGDPPAARLRAQTR